MHAPRFVTLCFIYAGVMLLATQAVVQTPGLTVATVVNGGAALCILFSGVYRLYSEDEERKPQEYGPLTYVIAGFAILVTLLFLGSLFIL